MAVRAIESSLGRGRRALVNVVEGSRRLLKHRVSRRHAKGAGVGRDEAGEWSGSGGLTRRYLTFTFLHAVAGGPISLNR